MSTDYAQMVEGCRRHDRRAQRTLYETFAPMAMGVCMRFATDRDAAQDLLQDGFVRVFEKIGQVHDAEQLGAWIYRLMLNVCIKACRRRRMAYIDDVPEDEGVLPLDPFAAEEVVMALQRIAPAQRAVFNLVVVEGYSFAEVASAMHCSEVNVRALLSRAKACLRNLLTEENKQI